MKHRSCHGTVYWIRQSFTLTCSNYSFICAYLYQKERKKNQKQHLCYWVILRNLAQLKKKCWCTPNFRCPNGALLSVICNTVFHFKGSANENYLIFKGNQKLWNFWRFWIFCHGFRAGMYHTTPAPFQRHDWFLEPWCFVCMAKTITCSRWETNFSISFYVIILICYEYNIPENFHGKSEKY